MLLKDKRFFYFEDDAQNQAIVQLILERNGAKVQFERWGHDPIPHLHDFMPIDIILTDLMFPNDVSGYDLFDIIRQEPAFDDIPILAISAADPTVEFKQSRAKGFSGYLMKPVHIIHFPQQLLAIIGGERVWQTV